MHEDRPEPDRRRSRRLDEIFGRDLETDEAGPADEDRVREQRHRDDWYQENRPPHHER